MSTLPTDATDSTSESLLTGFYQPDPVNWATIQSWLFAPLLPWQQQAWDYLTARYPDIPHAMLFAGNAGTGKRAFVYRFIAWALCHNRPSALPTVACGQCDSCQWLMAGTHPSLKILPEPLADTPTKPRATRPKANELQDQAPAHTSAVTLKIDDIRQMQPFVQQASQGSRIVVLHQADSMTLGASNALLKTLEEPADNVLLLLISDHPSRLLPTIRSRLQAIPVSRLTPQQSLDFMRRLSPQTDSQSLAHVNEVSGYAPLVALQMLHSRWYTQRQVWLSTWQALRSGQRSITQASDYWQKTLSLSDFLYLSQLMVSDINKQLLGFSLSADALPMAKLVPLPSQQALYRLQQTIDEIWLDKRQHLQDRLCYDKLLHTLQTC